jgi:hypothetical protein
MTQPQIKLVVATPCFGGMVTHHFMVSVLDLQRATASWGWKMHFTCIGGDALVQRARNTLVTLFLNDPEATHLMFIDADIGFQSAQVRRLLAFDKPLVGGAYPIKHIDWNAVRDRVADGTPHLEAASLQYVIGMPEGGVPFEEVDGFASVAHIGGGFMLIQRATLLAMIDRHPELVYTTALAGQNRVIPADERNTAVFDCMIDPVTRRYLPEDFSFCKRWKDMGGEVWIDLRSRLTHVGAHAYNGDLDSLTRVPAPAPNQT